MAQVRANKQIIATLVKDLVYVDSHKAEFVTGTEDLGIALETNALHLRGLIELVHSVARPITRLLLQHGKHVGFVLQLHRYLQQHTLNVI